MDDNGSIANETADQNKKVKNKHFKYFSCSIAKSVTPCKTHPASDLHRLASSG